MFRAMRRSKQQLTDEATLKILNEATNGVLALDGEEGYTYAVPLSFAYSDGKIYFHSALSGHKIDAIKKNDKVSFCVVGQDTVVQETFTAHYKSAIAFGRIRIIEDDSDPEKRRGLELLADKYSPEVSLEKREREINGKMKALVVIVIEIEYLTGKAAREIIRNEELIIRN
ncbi:MAG: pyridoxamine 5'-phosphate oxidase family protein [Selenomonadaceae bacterium]|nr:pyridoxamine 5'-phosphate oxidase family protein [Selenomonadaceae bacterium]